MGVTLPHLCFDLETLSTEDNACIVQIGAVRFDPFAEDRGLISTPEGEFRVNVLLRPQWPGAKGCELETLGTLDADTVLWWMAQSEDARRRVFDDPNRIELCRALKRFWGWVQSQGEPEHVWCALDFDMRILAQACKRLGTVFPFNRKAGRDYRTIRWVGEMLGVEQPEFVGVRHDALDDSHHQAIHTSNVLRKLKGML